MPARRRLYRGTEFDDILTRHRPDLIVTGTPGVQPARYAFVACGPRGKGIETATVMLSWDNLTSKGYMGATPDHLLVWSDLMAGEAIEHHNFPEKRIHWCGLRSSIIYQGVRERFDRMAWRREHGVPEGRPLVVYGTINPALLPHELNILRQIVTDSWFGRNIRCIPISGFACTRRSSAVTTAMSLAPFRELAGPDVFIEEPPVQSDKLPLGPAQGRGRAPGPADGRRRRRRHARFDVDDRRGLRTARRSSTSSSMATSRSIPPCRRVDSRNTGTNAKILETGGIAPARNIDEFVAIVDAYIRNPALDAEKREALIRQQMNCLDGQAGVRTAMELLQLADHHH